MAVPQLASAGNAPTVKMLAAGNITQNRTNKLLQQLVDLTKTLVDGQTKMFQQLLLVLDQKAGETAVQQASGSVGETEEIPEEFSVSKLFAGAFVALTLWSNELDKYIRSVWLAKTLASFAKIPDSIKAAFTTLSTKIKNTKVFKTLSTSIDNFFAGFKNVGKVMGAVKTPVAIKEFKTLSGKIGATIGKITKPIMSGFTKVMDFLKPIGNVFKSLSGLSSVGKTIKPIVEMAKKFAPLAKGILSKVLLPLFAIFDFVSGFIEGFSSKGEDDSRGMLEKIFDGMVQGAVEVIRGIFIIPLDLLKSGLSWLLGKLGFSEAEKLLDSFSFNEMYDKMIAIYKNFFSTEPEEGYFSIVKFIMDSIDGMIKYVKGLLDMNPADALKKLAGDALDIITAPHRWLWNNAIKPAIDSIIKMFGGSAELPDTGEIGDMATNFLKKLLRSVLPNPDAGFIQNLASKAIPNSVYEFAGLDPKTGKELPAAIADTSEIKPTGAQLAADTQDVATKKEEKQAGTTVVSAPSDKRDMSQTSINSSTYLAPSPSSYPSDPNWDFEDARGR